ncbi:hypothetical protein [Pseudoneobacillus sp. C159]
MDNGKQSNILNELAELPKPIMDKEIQEQMLLKIEAFSAKNEKKKKWGIFMKKIHVGMATVVAVLVISIISVSILIKNVPIQNQQSDQPIVTPGNQDMPGIEQVFDSIDDHLPEHQVAMDDLYFTIPEKRENVFIDRRVEGKFTIVDIRDKQTNKLQYRFGETTGDSTEKMVFREIQVPNMKTAIRLIVYVEMDKENGMITKITNQKVSYEPQPYRIDLEKLYAWSRTDRFPVELVSVQAHIQLAIKNDTVDPAKIMETEMIETGHEIGVIKQD